MRARELPTDMDELNKLLAERYGAGYRAGRRKMEPQEVRAHVMNERVTQIGAAVASALITKGTWGTGSGEDHRIWDWEQVQQKAAEAANAIALGLDYYD